MIQICTVHNSGAVRQLPPPPFATARCVNVCTQHKATRAPIRALCTTCVQRVRIWLVCGSLKWSAKFAGCLIVMGLRITHTAEVCLCISNKSLVACAFPKITAKECCQLLPATDFFHSPGLRLSVLFTRESYDYLFFRVHLCTYLSPRRTRKNGVILADHVTEYRNFLMRFRFTHAHES